MSKFAPVCACRAGPHRRALRVCHPDGVCFIYESCLRIGLSIVIVCHCAVAAALSAPPGFPCRAPRQQARALSSQQLRARAPAHYAHTRIGALKTIYNHGQPDACRAASYAPCTVPTCGDRALAQSCHNARRTVCGASRSRTWGVTCTCTPRVRASLVILSS